LRLATRYQDGLNNDSHTSELQSCGFRQ
jgi:hypothetical protein